MKKMKTGACILLALLLALPLLLQGTPASAAERNHHDLYDADELIMYNGPAVDSAISYDDSSGVFYVKAYQRDGKYLMGQIGKHALKDLPFNKHEGLWVLLMVEDDGGELYYAGEVRSHQHSFVDGTCQFCGYIAPMIHKVEQNMESAYAGDEIGWTISYFTPDKNGLGPTYEIYKGLHELVDSGAIHEGPGNVEGYEIRYTTKTPNDYHLEVSFDWKHINFSTRKFSDRIAVNVPEVKDFTAEVVQEGVQLRWKLTGGVANKFNIWRRSSEGGFVGYATVTENSFLDKNVEKGKLYGYKVCAIVSDPDDPTAYRGNFSDPQTAAIIDAPTGLEAELVNGGKEVRVKWDAMGGVGGYQLMRGKLTKPGETGTATKQVYRGDATSYADKDVKPGDKLVYRVRSFVYYGGLPSPGLLSDHVYISISTGIKGDANNDGKVDLLDLISLTGYLVKGTPCPAMDNADADGSGGKPNIQDMVWIINQLVK